MSVLQQMAKKMAQDGDDDGEEVVIGADGEIIKKSDAILDKHGNVVGKKSEMRRLSRKNTQS